MRLRSEEPVPADRRSKMMVTAGLLLVHVTATAVEPRPPVGMPIINRLDTYAEDGIERACGCVDGCGGCGPQNTANYTRGREVEQ